MSVPLDQMSDYARGVVADLGLEAHPEGGWYVRDWQSPQTDEASHRPLSSLIYFLLPEGDMSAWHKVDADEIWLWHGPAPVTLQLGGTGDSPAGDGTVEWAMRLSPVWSVPVLCSTDSRSNNASPSIMRYHIMRYRVRRFRNINSL